MDIFGNGCRLFRALEGLFEPFSFKYIPETPSTNSLLKELIHAGQLTTPTVLYTDFQSAGRGSRGRVWYQPAEDLQRLGLDLALSMAAPREGPRLASPRLSLYAGAFTAVIAERTLYLHGMKRGGHIPAAWSLAAVKWPNDVLVQTAAGWRKAGGILIETTAAPDGQRWVIIGIGLNVNSLCSQFPPELTGQVGTLREWRSHQTGIPLGEAFLDREELLSQYAGELAAFGLGRGLSDADLLTAWHARNRTAGTRYTFTREGEQRQVSAVEVDRASGGLWVADAAGRRWLVTAYSELGPPVDGGGAL